MAGSDYPFGLPGPLGFWRPQDRWLFGYLAATLPVLAWGGRHGVPGCAGQIGVDAIAIGVGLGMLRLSADTRRIAPTVLRLFYPPLLYLLLYHQIQTLWPVLHRAPLDPVLVRAEAALFACQPSLAFHTALPWRGLSELFCFAYLAYYFFVPVVGFTALFRNGYRSAERLLLPVTACFLCCYAVFWLAPTVGPHYWFPPHAGPALYDGFLCNHILYAFTGAGEIRGGACPSSHIAVALLITLSARREHLPLWPALAIITALMLPAVVYLLAHYLLDVPAGLLTGLAAYALSTRCQSPNG